MSAADTPAPETLDDARRQAAALAGGDAPRAKRAPRKRAPRKRAPAGDKAPTGGARPPALKKQIEDSITALGAVLLLFNPADAQCIIAGAPQQAAALDALAKKNPAVRRALELLLTASVYGQLIAAFAPTVLGIAANHGKVPPLVAGIVGATLSGTPAGPTAESPLDLATIASMAAMFTGEGGDSDAGAPFGRIVGVG